MRLATEKAMFSRPHRLPGLQSSNISLETVMGTDSTIDFTDFLNGEIFVITMLPCRMTMNLNKLSVIKSVLLLTDSSLVILN